MAAFVGMVALWASAADAGARFDGGGVSGPRHACWRPGVLTLEDIAKEGDVLATFIWFAVLFTLSSQLNELGFMGFLGQRLAGSPGRPVRGVGRPGAGGRVRAAALRVRQPDGAPARAASACSSTSASSLACRRRRSRFNCCSRRTTSRRSRRRDRARTCCSRAAGSCRKRDLYRLGGMMTAFNMVLYLVVGTPWLRLVAR